MVGFELLKKTASAIMEFNHQCTGPPWWGMMMMIFRWTYHLQSWNACSVTISMQQVLSTTGRSKWVQASTQYSAVVRFCLGEPGLGPFFSSSESILEKNKQLDSPSYPPFEALVCLTYSDSHHGHYGDASPRLYQISGHTCTKNHAHTHQRSHFRGSIAPEVWFTFNCQYMNI